VSGLALAVLGSAALLAGLLLVAAVFTWVERRLLGLFQERLGPNRAGPGGSLQWVADIGKILTKEDWTPPHADRAVFVLAPAAATAPVLAGFALAPISEAGALAPLPGGLLLVFGMTGLTAYAVILGGWASNSKYSLLGGMRAAAQMLSYEVFLGLAALGAVIQAGTLDPGGIVTAQREGWFLGPQALGAALFLIGGVAAAHRLPFDLPEAENDLTAGYHTEYSGMKFGLFFVGEYLLILLVSALFATLFLGGWLGPWLPGAAWFGLKAGAVALLFVLLRAALPRPTYDQLMRFAWTVCLPLALLNVLATGAVVVLAGGGA